MYRCEFNSRTPSWIPDSSRALYTIWRCPKPLSQNRSFANLNRTGRKVKGLSRCRKIRPGTNWGDASVLVLPVLSKYRCGTRRTSLPGLRARGARTCSHTLNEAISDTTYRPHFTTITCWRLKHDYFILQWQWCSNKLYMQLVYKALFTRGITTLATFACVNVPLIQRSITLYCINNT